MYQYVTLISIYCDTYFKFIITEQTPELFKIKSLTPPSFKLIPFWPDNTEAWFCYSKADFHKHGLTDPRAQLAVVKALPLDFNRHVTPSMSTSDVSEPYETLKRSTPKSGDLTDRQSLDQLFHNINLQYDSATDMLLRMRGVISQQILDDGLFRQIFLSMLPQKVQAVLVSFQNNAVNELAASADRILRITRISNAGVCLVKEKPQTTRDDVMEFCHTLTHYLRIRHDRRRSQTP